jgi:hypothetical protein
MTGFKHEPRLHGWDDEKVYFWDETGKEWCVSDYPDLVAWLVEICRDYFAPKATTRSGNKGGDHGIPD